jgi:hypothetical protein
MHPRLVRFLKSYFSREIETERLVDGHSMGASPSSGHPSRSSDKGG